MKFSLFVSPFTLSLVRIFFWYHVSLMCGVKTQPAFDLLIITARESMPNLSRSLSLSRLIIISEIAISSPLVLRVLSVRTLFYGKGDRVSEICL
jgi:site-specific recombinase XerC